MLATLKEIQLATWNVLPFFKLCSARVSALLTVFGDSCVKELENWRLVQFLKRTDRWCAFSWSIYDKNCHIIRYIEGDNF
jgi:hypothetical protein